jgi:TetR/AcrR family transcriptional regulator, lmrAB and yxaGH operons repressor
MHVASEVRTTMIEGAAVLLAKHGLQGTSFSEVLEYTGAPRGSVYHHFPGGKDQLVGEAVEFTGANVYSALQSKAGAPATEIADFFLALWRSVLTRSNFSAGCAVLAVTVAAEPGELADRAAGVFRRWREHLAALLEQGGLAPGDAARMSALLIASSEGAVVLSRAERSLEPFDLVAEQLREQVAGLEQN